MRVHLRRLWPRGRRSSLNPPTAPIEDPLLVAGRQLRQRREQRQLSLRELAIETRISTSVLEALERGWRDRLPESTYLRTMLPLIERHLDLEPGSLEAILPDRRDNSRSNPRRQQRQRFTPGSINVFSSWQGTVLYGLVTLGLIYALNLQQQRLARMNLSALAPIPATPQSRSAAQGQQDSGIAILLRAYPELRPLSHAENGQSLELWREAISP